MKNNNQIKIPELVTNIDVINYTQHVKIRTEVFLIKGKDRLP